MRPLAKTTILTIHDANLLWLAIKKGLYWLIQLSFAIYSDRDGNGSNKVAMVDLRSE